MTICENVLNFKRTKQFSYFFIASCLILKQGRLFEVFYGIFCFLINKPSKVCSAINIDILEYLEISKKLLSEKHAQCEKILLEAQSQLNNFKASLNSEINNFILIENGFVFGEYAENSSRILVKNTESYVIHNFYENNRGVRHIHSILQHGGYAFISTGDSNKYLDRYRIVNGDLVYDSRILRHLGGFTACCVIDGMCFFGTDFSERPNYIFSLKTRKKFFFPHPAYTQYCYLMLAVHDRYIFCINESMDNIPNRKSISIFDTKNSSFIYCKEYSEKDF